MLFCSKAVLALVISATLITSCSKNDLEYKRRRNTQTTTPAPAPTTPTPAPTPVPAPVPATTVSTTGYLALTKAAARNITNQSNVIIENLQFENIAGIVLNITGSNNITIRNCFFNKSTAEAINIEGSANITIDKCLFNGVITGVYALNSQTIKVNNSQFVNVKRNASGGRGQCVQFNNVTGAGNEVNNNKGENFLGEGDPEDLISMYKSSGTAASPISIRNNIFRGGGPSASGGGIMLGDYGGSYQIAENNILLNPGQYGMAASGGNYIQILNNKIFAKQQYFSNNPLYVANYSPTTCGIITVKGNRVNWTDKDGNKNGGWNQGSCDNTSYEYGTTITETELGVPSHLISMITPAELLAIRK